MPGSRTARAPWPWRLIQWEARYADYGRLDDNSAGAQARAMA